MIFFSHQKLQKMSTQQQWHRRRADKLSAAARRGRRTALLPGRIGQVSRATYITLGMQLNLVRTVRIEQVFESCNADAQKEVLYPESSPGNLAP